MSFIESVELVGTVIDGVGVAVIALGGAFAAGVAVARARKGTGTAYRDFREQLGRAILLGLEFLVAADIIKTVAITPTAQSVGLLAGIVAIRTFLSFSLEVEMTGRWPWQRRDSDADSDTAPAASPL